MCLHPLTDVVFLNASTTGNLSCSEIVSSHRFLIAAVASTSPPGDCGISVRPRLRMRELNYNELSETLILEVSHQDKSIYTQTKFQVWLISGQA